MMFCDVSHIAGMTWGISTLLSERASWLQGQYPESEMTSVLVLAYVAVNLSFRVLVLIDGRDFFSPPSPFFFFFLTLSYRGEIHTT